MTKILSFILFLMVSTGATAQVIQVIGIVDKKTKEYSVAPNQKGEYRVFGYQFAGDATKKMICFSTHDTDVRGNSSNCPLGAYYDTDRMRPGDKIYYLGNYGTFGKMSYVSGAGVKTIFYLPKKSFVIK
ncbi:MAG: hypothetical protein JST75_01680 [Bacteroidetes bacterium]|nr:hypothetical protein [Bacteroidota bacterium]